MRGLKDRSIYNLFQTATSDDADNNGVAYACAEELEHMTPHERYVAWFNWHVKEIIPYYKSEVMRLHQLSDEEYNRG